MKYVEELNKAFFIDPNLYPLIINHVCEYLSEKEIDYIIRNVDLTILEKGKDIDANVSWLKIFKKGMDKTQLEYHVLRRAEDYTNWILNPEMIEVTKTTNAYKNSDKKTILNGKETYISDSMKSVKILCERLDNLIKNKEQNVEDEKIGLYQIDRMIQGPLLAGNVFYIGQVEIRDGSYYLIDSYYHQTKMDAIKIRPFVGIELLIGILELGILGRVTTVNGEPELVVNGALVLM